MTTSAFRLDVSGDHIAQVVFDLPGSKANTLGQAILTELEEVLGQLETRSDVQGLIFFSGKPGMFIAGADLKELGGPVPVPDEAGKRRLVKRGLDIVARVECLPFPTVALIDGACMGGGLELALGFDYRIAGSHPKVDIGLPETKIGLIPGWGGTQRLSRVIGPGPAAELICAGDSVSAKRARDLRLVFDAVPSEKLFEEGGRLLAWARETGNWREARKKKQLPVGLTSDQHSFTFAVLKATILTRTKGQLPAPLAALDAIAEGCNLPLNDGLAIETERFLPLLGSEISRNLIAVFFMTQRLQKDAGIADTSIRARAVERVGVVGAGIMGAGIAGAHIRRGVPTMLSDVSAQAIEKGVGAIAKVMKSRVEIGRMTQDEVLGAITLLQSTPNLKQLSDCDVIIEAVVEKEEVKTGLYRELARIVPADAILASNTSTISITRMAQAVKNPANFAGLHFFNPVDRMALVEVIRGTETSDATVATLVALAKRISKTPIVVRDGPGFLVNRILFPYINEALLLLEQGIKPRDIDRAATAFGMPMGPITLNDLVGLDTALYAGDVINSAFAERLKSSPILEVLVRAGRLGQKSGAGFYNYAKNAKGADDPVFDQLLEPHIRDRQNLSTEEITDRLFLPMVVEASYVLEEGIVREPADVDMGLILGIGFPPQRGGILRWADSLGLANVVAKLARYEKEGLRFEPTTQMRTLAEAGKGFYR